MNGSNYTSQAMIIDGPPDLFVKFEPIACFPELLDTSPKNFILCLLYILGTSAAAATGIYFYLKNKRNACKDNRQNSSKSSGY